MESATTVVAAVEADADESFGIDEFTREPIVVFFFRLVFLGGGRGTSGHGAAATSSLVISEAIPRGNMSRGSWCCWSKS